MRFIVWDFRDLQQFINFLLREMFSPKRYKADFERNCKILTVKPLILNKITKFSLETFSSIQYVLYQMTATVQ